MDSLWDRWYLKGFRCGRDALLDRVSGLALRQNSYYVCHMAFIHMEMDMLIIFILSYFFL